MYYDKQAEQLNTVQPISGSGESAGDKKVHSFSKRIFGRVKYYQYRIFMDKRHRRFDF